MLNIFNFLSFGYFGGITEVYKPYGQNLKYFDVNSLYPYVMAHFPMPTGKPKFFYGDIRKNEYYAFGFFYVRVTAPDDIRVPILLTRINRSTIAPIGTWEGMYFSEELYNAESYGYKFEIIFGYLFEKSKILFADYIKNLYTIKKERSSKDAKYIISKMLMNSLYGRFGMNPYRESHQIVDTLSNPTFYQDYDVNNVIDLSNGKELVSFLDFNKQSDFEPIRNISIVIARGGDLHRGTTTLAVPVYRRTGTRWHAADGYAQRRSVRRRRVRAGG